MADESAQAEQTDVDADEDMNEVVSEKTAQADEADEIELVAAREGTFAAAGQPSRARTMPSTPTHPEGPPL